MLHSVYISARLSLPVTLVTFELTVFCYFFTPLLSLTYFLLNLFFFLQKSPSPSLCAVPVTPDCFVTKKGANDGEYVEMPISEKPKNHLSSLRDKADGNDQKLFIDGMSNCPVEYFKTVLSVLNPDQTSLFEKPPGHFRVPLCLCLKTSPSAKPFLWKWLWFAWKWNCMQNSFSDERFPSDLDSF